MPNTSVFFSYLMSFFTGVLLRYVVSVLGMLPVTPVVLVYTTVLFLHSTCAEFYLLLLLLLS
jgi:hypothetical protein